MANNLVNSFTSKLRESTLAKRFRQQAEAKLASAQKAVKENLTFSELSKTMTFSHSKIFDDSGELNLSPITPAEESCMNTSGGSNENSDGDDHLKTSSGEGEDSLPSDFRVREQVSDSTNTHIETVQVELHHDVDLYQQQEARDRLEVEEKKLKIREEEMKLRREQAARDEAETRRHREQEKDLDDTFRSLQDTLNNRLDHVNRIQVEHQPDEASTKEEGVNPAQDVEEKEQLEESVPKCLEEEQRREATIRQLQKTLAEEQKALEWSREKTRKEQQKLIENIPQNMAANREAQLKEAKRKEEERKKQVEDLHHWKQEQLRKEKAESDYIKDLERRDAESRARKKEQGHDRKQHIQFLQDRQSGKTDLMGGATHARKAARKTQTEEDAEIAKRLQEEELLDRERYNAWNAIQKLQEEQEKRHKALEAEEERLRFEEQKRKVEQMKKDNDERESRLRKKFEAGASIEEDSQFVDSPPSTGGMMDYFQTPAFNPKRRSTLRSLTAEFPDSKSEDLPTLRGTFSVPRRGHSQAALPIPEAPDEKARRREFERTVMEAGGVTLEEQERLEMEAAEDMSASVNPSSVSFTVSRSKEEIPTFSGDIIDYKDWKTLFESYMTPFLKPEHLSTLKKKLGKQEVLISGCTGLTESALNRCWVILDSTFGSEDYPVDTD